MTKVAVAMLGARRHYAVPRLLHEAGLLDRFFTDSYIGNKPWLEAGLRSIPARIRPGAVTRWLGRKSDSLPLNKVTSFEKLGMWYAWSLSRSRSTAEKQKLFLEVGQNFNRKILDYGLGESELVWGFNSASLGLVEVARSMGLRSVLDQTSNPRSIERELASEEHASWPGWGVSEQEVPMDMQREQLEAREWELVDRIVVGSQFVADGLVGKGVDRSKIIVVPYGVDLNRFSWVKRRERENQNDPLRVLFVGRVSVMKGIPSLLHALSVLGPQKVQARLVGGSAIKAHRIEEFRGVANFVGHVPRSSILDHYRWADVLCFPSITEGSAAVTYEALATGLPVITTPNAGSIVRDGLDGFIVPIRSPEKLAEALQRYADDPALLAAHQEQLRSGRERAGLECYKRDIVKVVEDLGC